MKLTDLSPRWITVANWASPELYAIGISFLCPHCDPSLPDHGPNRRRRLAVFFWPPIDEGRYREKCGPDWGRPHMPEDWTRTSGDSFADSFAALSLTPSVNAEASGHWHGFITNGEVK